MVLGLNCAHHAAPTWHGGHFAGADFLIQLSSISLGVLVPLQCTSATNIFYQHYCDSYPVVCCNVSLHLLACFGRFNAQWEANTYMWCGVVLEKNGKITSSYPHSPSLPKGALNKDDPHSFPLGSHGLVCTIAVWLWPPSSKGLSTVSLPMGSHPLVQFVPLALLFPLTSPDCSSLQMSSLCVDVVVLFC